MANRRGPRLARGDFAACRYWRTKRRNWAVGLGFVGAVWRRRAGWTDFPHKIVETEDMGIVTSARVWTPEDAGLRSVPAIPQWIPCRKRDGTVPRDEMMHRWIAGHGHAAVRVDMRVDMRGNGDSQGRSRATARSRNRSMPAR